MMVEFKYIISNTM